MVKQLFSRKAVCQTLISAGIRCCFVIFGPNVTNDFLLNMQLQVKRLVVLFESLGLLRLLQKFLVLGKNQRKLSIIHLISVFFQSSISKQREREKLREGEIQRKQDPRKKKVVFLAYLLNNETYSFDTIVFINLH